MLLLELPMARLKSKDAKAHTVLSRQFVSELEKASLYDI
jgi:hypothetical protein